VDQRFALILDYLTKHFSTEELSPGNVIKAATIIADRAKTGKFKSITYVKNGPQGGCGEDRSQRRRHCILIPAAFIDA
jgi:hypothetical protein